MGGYNLDEKSDLFGKSNRNNKLVAPGKDILFKHFNLKEFVTAKVLETTEEGMKISLNNSIDFAINSGDLVLLRYEPLSEDYFFSCRVISNVQDGKTISFAVEYFDKKKSQQKSKKYYINLPGNIKIIGIADNRPVTAKKICDEALKFECKEDIMMEDTIDLTLVVDKSSKLSFRGSIVRKNKLKDTFEYGVMMNDMTDGNKKTLYSLMMSLENE